MHARRFEESCRDGALLSVFVDLNDDPCEMPKPREMATHAGLIDYGGKRKAALAHPPALGALGDPCVRTV